MIPGHHFSKSVSENRGKLLDPVLGARHALERRNMKQRIALVRERKLAVADNDAVERRLDRLFVLTHRVADHGERARAANEMLKLVESNLGHDNVEGWITELVEIVRGGTISEEELLTDGDEEEAPATGTE